MLLCMVVRCNGIRFERTDGTRKRHGSDQTAFGAGLELNLSSVGFGERTCDSDAQTESCGFGRQKRCLQSVEILFGKDFAGVSHAYGHLIAAGKRLNDDYRMRCLVTGFQGVFQQVGEDQFELKLVGADTQSRFAQNVEGCFTKKFGIECGADAFDRGFDVDRIVS